MINYALIHYNTYGNVMLATVKRDPERGRELNYRQPDLYFSINEIYYDGSNKSTPTIKNVLEKYGFGYEGCTSHHESRVRIISKEECNDIINEVRNIDLEIKNQEEEADEYYKKYFKIMDEKYNTEIELKSPLLFTIWFKDKTTGQLKVSKISNRFGIISLNGEIVRNGATIIDATTPINFAYTLDKRCYLTFRNDKIEVTKHTTLIDDIWKMADNGSSSCLYKYTTDYWNNWCD